MVVAVDDANIAERTNSTILHLTGVLNHIAKTAALMKQELTKFYMTGINYITQSGGLPSAIATKIPLSSTNDLKGTVDSYVTQNTSIKNTIMQRMLDTLVKIPFPQLVSGTIAALNNDMAILAAMVVEITGAYSLMKNVSKVVAAIPTQTSNTALAASAVGKDVVDETLTQLIAFSMAGSVPETIRVAWTKYYTQFLTLCKQVIQTKRAGNPLDAAIEALYMTLRDQSKDDTARKNALEAFKNQYETNKWSNVATGGGPSVYNAAFVLGLGRCFHDFKYTVPANTNLPFLKNTFLTNDNSVLVNVQKFLKPPSNVRSLALAGGSSGRKYLTPRELSARAALNKTRKEFEALVTPGLSTGIIHQPTADYKVEISPTRLTLTGERTSGAEQMGIGEFNPSVRANVLDNYKRLSAFYGTGDEDASEFAANGAFEQEGPLLPTNRKRPFLSGEIYGGKRPSLSANANTYATAKERVKAATARATNKLNDEINIIYNNLPPQLTFQRLSASGLNMSSSFTGIDPASIASLNDPAFEEYSTHRLFSANEKLTAGDIANRLIAHNKDAYDYIKCSIAALDQNKKLEQLLGGKLASDVSVTVLNSDSNTPTKDKDTTGTSIQQKYLNFATILNQRAEYGLAGIKQESDSVTSSLKKLYSGFVLSVLGWGHKALGVARYFTTITLNDLELFDFSVLSIIRTGLDKNHPKYAVIQPFENEFKDLSAFTAELMGILRKEDNLAKRYFVYSQLTPELQTKFTTLLAAIHPDAPFASQSSANVVKINDYEGGISDYVIKKDPDDQFAMLIDDTTGASPLIIAFGGLIDVQDAPLNAQKTVLATLKADLYTAYTNLTAKFGTHMELTATGGASDFKNVLKFRELRTKELSSMPVEFNVNFADKTELTAFGMATVSGYSGLEYAPGEPFDGLHPFWATSGKITQAYPILFNFIDLLPGRNTFQAIDSRRDTLFLNQTKPRLSTFDGKPMMHPASKLQIFIGDYAGGQDYLQVGNFAVTAAKDTILLFDNSLNRTGPLLKFRTNNAITSGHPVAYARAYRTWTLLQDAFAAATVTNFNQVINNGDLGTCFYEDYAYAIDYAPRIAPISDWQKKILVCPYTPNSWDTFVAATYPTPKQYDNAILSETSFTSGIEFLGSSANLADIISFRCHNSPHTDTPDIRRNILIRQTSDISLLSLSIKLLEPPMKVLGVVDEILSWSELCEKIVEHQTFKSTITSGMTQLVFDGIVDDVYGIASKTTHINDRLKQSADLKSIIAKSKFKVSAVLDETQNITIVENLMQIAHNLQSGIPIALYTIAPSGFGKTTTLFGNASAGIPGFITTVFKTFSSSTKLNITLSAYKMWPIAIPAIFEKTFGQNTIQIKIETNLPKIDKAGFTPGNGQVKKTLKALSDAEMCAIQANPAIVTEYVDRIKAQMGLISGTSNNPQSSRCGTCVTFVNSQNNTCSIVDLAGNENLEYLIKPAPATMQMGNVDKLGTPATVTSTAVEADPYAFLVDKPVILPANFFAAGTTVDVNFTTNGRVTNANTLANVLGFFYTPITMLAKRFIDLVPNVQFALGSPQWHQHSCWAYHTYAAILSKHASAAGSFEFANYPIITKPTATPPPDPSKGEFYKFVFGDTAAKDKTELIPPAHLEPNNVLCFQGSYMYNLDQIRLLVAAISGMDDMMSKLIESDEFWDTIIAEGSAEKMFKTANRDADGIKAKMSDVFDKGLIKMFVKTNRTGATTVLDALNYPIFGAIVHPTGSGIIVPKIAWPGAIPTNKSTSIVSMHGVGSGTKMFGKDLTWAGVSAQYSEATFIGSRTGFKAQPKELWLHFLSQNGYVVENHRKFLLFASILIQLTIMKLVHENNIAMLSPAILDFYFKDYAGNKAQYNWACTKCLETPWINELMNFLSLQANKNPDAIALAKSEYLNKSRTFASMCWDAFKYYGDICETARARNPLAEKLGTIMQKDLDISVDMLKTIKFDEPQFASLGAPIEIAIDNGRWPIAWPIKTLANYYDSVRLDGCVTGGATVTYPYQYTYSNTELISRATMRKLIVAQTYAEWETSAKPFIITPSQVGISYFIFKNEASKLVANAPQLITLNSLVGGAEEKK